MLALSTRQPWAWLIINGHIIQPDGRITGFKDVENRSRDTKVRGRIYVHSTVSSNPSGWNWFWSRPKILRGVDVAGLINGIAGPVRGAIIGEVDIVGCVTDSKSPWAEAGKYHWMLANPKAYAEPIQMRGHPGFWTPELPGDRGNQDAGYCVGGV